MPARMSSPLPAEALRAGARYRVSRRATLLGMALNGVLATVKLAGGVFGHSQALIADGLDSLSDLVTDTVVLFGARQAARAPDPGHPYGHGRAETMVTLLLGAILIATALGIAYRSALHVTSAAATAPAAWTLGVALFSIASKELFYQYLVRVGRQARSRMLEANAWHHRTDSISSVVVLLGLAGALMGLPYLDAVAAIAVAMLVAKVGWELGWRSVAELMDTALSKDRVAHIRDLIEQVHGVRDLHMLRTRHAGSEALVDVHVIVDPRISVSEGHRIAETIRERVTGTLDEVSDVLVHVDSEDDHGAMLGQALPLRETLEAQIRGTVAGLPGGQALGQVVLHYLRDRVSVELVLPLASVESPAQAHAIADGLKRAVRALPHVAQAEVHYAA